MKVVALSDTHMYHESVVVPECDLLLHAGDFSRHGRWYEEVEPFIRWFAKQPAKHKVLIPGNHEVFISMAPALMIDLCNELGIHLLINEHVVIEGKKIFGSPFTPTFGSWAYMADDDKLQEVWDMIEPDTEIVLVHGPPKGMLDRTLAGDCVGSETLWQHLGTLKNLKLFVCGHIHESRGSYQIGELMFINAAICGIPYSRLRPPVVLELK